MQVKELLNLLEDKKTSLDFILHLIDNRIIFYTKGELFLKKRKFNLCKCDRKISSFIARKIIEKCEDRDEGIVDCLLEAEEKIDEIS